jgi:phenylalanyl-tRNA synthetase beta chain
LITNGETPLALAGIMGGKNSGINDDTKTVVLEAASFNATNIRRTRTRLNLKTESADRFEKEIDPNLTEKAMVRLIEILEHTASGKLESIVDAYPKKTKPIKIKLDLEYVNNLLGEKVLEKEVTRILNLLGIKTLKALGASSLRHPVPSALVCEVPTYRIDLKTREDLIEEIGRVWGYEKIKSQPLYEPVLPVNKNEQVFFERKVQELLIGLGYDEMYNYSFYSEKDANSCGFGDIKHLELENPMNPDQKFVRVSLVPNILKNIRDNIKHFKNFNLFEIGKIYYPEKKRAEERRMLIMAISREKDYNGENFFELKGSIEDLMEASGVRNGLEFIPPALSLELPMPRILVPGRSARILINGIEIGMIAEVGPEVLADYKIDRSSAMAEIDLEKLREAVQKEKQYQPLRRFPTSDRDVSILSDGKKTAAQIAEYIRNCGGGLLIAVNLFDSFKKDGKASLAYHLEFGADDRTLESAEIDEVMGKITSGLEKELEVEIRK